jgi:hypothetical protein
MVAAVDHVIFLASLLWFGTLMRTARTVVVMPTQVTVVP